MGTDHTAHWYVFGGAGFIGQHLARSVLSGLPGSKVTLLDIRDPGAIGWQPGLNRFFHGGALDFMHCDVREAIHVEASPSANVVMVNLAAVHREPGHRSEEYFETNLKGAENICHFAESTGCKEITFTSSISVYGEYHATADEDSEPSPKTAYGQSKLQAEQIHLDWANRTGGRLSIIRPGVVFGPSEGGNVTRLVKESLRRQRAIHLKPDLAKAGIYIEELLALIHWLRQQLVDSGKPLLVNGVSEELLYFNDYGKTLQALKQFEAAPLNIPVGALAAVLKLASPLKFMVPAASKFHPERLLKLTRPNAICSRRLKEMNYPFSWPLDRAMADWLSRGI